MIRTFNCLRLQADDYNMAFPQKDVRGWQQIQRLSLLNWHAVCNHATEVSALSTGTLNVGSIWLFVGTTEFRFPRHDRAVWSSLSLLLRVTNRRMWHCSTGWVGATDFERGAQRFRGRWSKHFFTVQLRVSLSPHTLSIKGAPPPHWDWEEETVLCVASSRLRNQGGHSMQAV